VHGSLFNERKERGPSAKNDPLRVHEQKRYALHCIFARLTAFVETQSDRRTPCSGVHTPGTSIVRGWSGRAGLRCHRMSTQNPEASAAFPDKPGKPVQLQTNRKIRSSFGGSPHLELALVS
jgi:hypothetical protein